MCWPEPGLEAEADQQPHVRLRARRQVRMQPAECKRDLDHKSDWACADEHGCVACSPHFMEAAFGMRLLEKLCVISPHNCKNS